MAENDWPFTQAELDEMVRKIQQDRGLLLLAQTAEHYSLTVAEVIRRLKDDSEFKEDVLIWHAVSRLRQAMAGKMQDVRQANRGLVVHRNGR